ncbi:MAG: hypothetical protein MUP58_02190 [Candidatus Nanohaloarchaeota archaeon QJJ-9]|nr:hypothetical protein [Candidatus Nanohaloarchaeota archaeon QJJ-9]
MSEEETVMDRMDRIYVEDLDDALDYYREVQAILTDLEFDRVTEGRAESWDTLPIKQTIEAEKWKDPYTKIEIEIGASVSDPNNYSREDQNKELYKVKMAYEVNLIRTKSPRKTYLQERPAWFKRSWVYRNVVKRFAWSSIFNKDIEKYKEEAEELGLEVLSRIREAEESTPAIGRSKREYMDTDFRGD